MAELTQIYSEDWERMHAACKWVSYDGVVSFPTWAYVPLARWGDVGAATRAFDRMLPAAHHCLDDCTAAEVLECIAIENNWPFWLFCVGRHADARALLHAGPFNNLESFVDWSIIPAWVVFISSILSGLVLPLLPPPYFLIRSAMKNVWFGF